MQPTVQYRTSDQVTSNVFSRITITPIIWLRSPPNVRFIRMAFITLQTFIQFRVTWRLVDAQNIQEIYALDIPFLFYCRGRLLGLEHLKVLDVSGSMMDVEQHFYEDLPGLKVLVLNSILPLNYFQIVVSCKRLLRNLTSLTYLDLTNNGLNTLLPGTFTSNVLLTYLVLARNRFSSIPFEFHTTPRLRYLDMTENAVPYLEEQEMSAIDAQIHQTGDFTLKLHGNAIVCLCSNIKFLAWLQTTHTNLDYGGNYTCTSQDGRITSTGHFSDTQGVWRQCVGSLSLMVSLIIASLMALTFLSVYLLMRFKTSLIAFVLNTIAPQCKAKTSRDYETDVFIGYADDDHRYVATVLKRFLEDDLGMTIFIHQRDLGVGFTDQLFFEAIHNSWRVMLVITATFLHYYDMADKVMKYASHSVTPVNQGRVFVLMEESQVQHIPSYLLDILDDTRIIIVHDLKLPLTYKQQMSIKQCMG
ncbi:unnamed protein product [Lymnaea stagnalis]|uniref:TIR domain-containing protein n=1 Tax=Lymnaea stagnalis TaxID=6523 RepID=A0AAV2I7M1_LYMST